MLRGGAGEGYQRSLQSGRIILDHLPTKNVISDIFVDRAGQWHFGGVPTESTTVFRDQDVVWSALHSSPEEEVSLRRLFEQRGINFIGPGSFASALALNKKIGAEFLRSTGLRTPHGLEFGRTDETRELASEIFRKISGPWVVGGQGSQARTLDELEALIDSAFQNSDEIWVEEYIKGKPATVFVIEGFRGQARYTLPIVAGGFSDEEKNILAETGRHAFEALNLRHFSQFDLVLHPSGRAYVIGVSLMPALHPDGVFHQSLSRIGAKLTQFLDHLVTLTSLT